MTGNATTMDRFASFARGPRLRFTLLFGAYLAAFASVFHMGDASLARLHLHPMSATAAASLNALGIAAHLDASHVPEGYCLIAMSQVTFRVIHECTGIFTVFILLAAILAYPASARARLLGGVGGVLAFFGYGSARLVLLGVLGRWGPELVSFTHVWLMGLTNLGFALCLWLLWIDRVRRHG